MQGRDRPLFELIEGVYDFNARKEEVILIIDEQSFIKINIFWKTYFVGRCILQN